MKKYTVLMQLLVLVLSLGLLVSGCSTSTSTSVDSQTGQAAQGEQTEQSRNDEPVTVSSDSSMGDDVAASTKSEEEQLNDKMMDIIADGSYETEVSYPYHSGTERMIVRVSVENNIVTAISLEGIQNHQVSARYIGGVNAELPKLVVGKRIDQVELPKQISGSSLTTAAVGKHLNDLIDMY
jgi:ABC-type Fe3+-hydroxamate transport system substrate-binding protein